MNPIILLPKKDIEKIKTGELTSIVSKFFYPGYRNYYVCVETSKKKEVLEVYIASVSSAGLDNEGRELHRHEIGHVYPVSLQPYIFYKNEVRQSEVEVYAESLDEAFSLFYKERDREDFSEIYVTSVEDTSYYQGALMPESSVLMPDGTSLEWYEAEKLI